MAYFVKHMAHDIISVMLKSYKTEVRFLLLIITRGKNNSKHDLSMSLSNYNYVFFSFNLNLYWFYKLYIRTTITSSIQALILEAKSIARAPRKITKVYRSNST